ncbi:MAG TPA: ABC transporter permease [Polyangia bacterium]|nr:ABC transporter permease [Polyangia bacterium]
MTTWREARLIFRQQLRLMLREPVWAVLGLIQPLLYLGLFGPLLKPLTSAPGFPPGSSWSVFVPGLLIQLAMFGTLFVGFGLIAEVRFGVVERMRVTPASRLALLAGRVMRDVLVLVSQAVLLIAIASVFGLRAPVGGLVLVLAIVCLLGVALSSFSYAVALKLKSEDALAQLLNSLAVPLLLLSGILLPMSLAPRWLYLLSRINPFSHVVDGARAAVRGDFGSGSLLVGFIAALALAVAGVAVGTRTFHRESA